MTLKRRYIGGRGLAYLGLSVGIISAGALVLVLPGIGRAADPTYMLPAPYTGNCYDGTKINFPVPINNTITPLPSCPGVTVDLQPGHGNFTSMCFEDYTAARAVTPSLSALSDLPGACQAVIPGSGGSDAQGTAAASFREYDFEYTTQADKSQEGYQTQNLVGWNPPNWGANWSWSPVYSPGYFVGNTQFDAQWIDREKSYNNYGVYDDEYTDRAGWYNYNGSSWVGVNFCCQWSSWNNNGGWVWGNDNWQTSQYWGFNNGYYQNADFEWDTHVSYFSGQGSLDNGSPNPDGVAEAYCNKDADCSTIPAQFYLPGQCRSFPGAVPAGDGHKGVCRYNNYRFIATSTYGANNGQQTYGKALYSNQVNISGGQVRMGESGFSGAWAGAGTNGGTNWVILHASNVIMPNLWATQWGRIFSGNHVISATMNINGTIYMEPESGTQNHRLTHTFLQFVANPATSVTLAWDVALNAVAQTSGTACGGVSPTDFTNGGGQGFNGCGCQVSMVVDSTSASSMSRLLNESWTTITQDDTKDVKIASYYNYRFVCNYSGGTAGTAGVKWLWNNP